MGCPTTARGVRLDRVESPVARLWLDRPPLVSRRGRVSARVGLRSALTERGSSTAASSARSLGQALDQGLRNRASLPALRSLPLVALRSAAAPPGFSDDRVVPSTSVTWRSVHAPAGSRVLLHRRVLSPALTLPPARDQFLPWVCFPFEARASTAVGVLGLPRIRSRLRSASGPRAPFGARDGRPGASVRGGSCDRRRSRPPWGSRRQRATVANLGFAAVSRRCRLSPLRRS